MEIPRQQFSRKLPAIKEAIDQCDFMAIDTELSGLHRTGNARRIDTMENRYTEYREATERFIIIQFGLCTFRWDEPTGRYIARPFNFYIFPTSMTGKIQPDRVFLTQAQAFDFLSKQGFDFNKWVYQGIPYLTVAEEKKLLEEATLKMKNDVPDIPVDKKELAFVEAAVNQVKAWVEATANGTEKSDGVNINTTNAYQRRLIYQEIRNNFKDLTPEGRPGFIRISRKSKAAENDLKEKERKVKKDCEYAVGFRKVIDMISGSRKLVIGHNMLLDVCHVIGQFIQPLPENVNDFKKLAIDVFPFMLDTKYLCSSTPELLEQLISGTSLEALRFETRREIFKNPHIDLDFEYTRYFEGDKEHEAGCDAYITGSVFLKLLSFSENLRNPLPPAPEADDAASEHSVEKERRCDSDGWELTDEEDDEKDDTEYVHNFGSRRVTIFKDGVPHKDIARYINKAALVRTGFEYFDFTQSEEIINQPTAFYICWQDGKPMPTALITKLFSSFGKHIIETTTDTSGYVIFERFEKDADAIVEATTKELEQLELEETGGLSVIPIAKHLASA